MRWLVSGGWSQKDEGMIRGWNFQPHPLTSREGKWTDYWVQSPSPVLTGTIQPIEGMNRTKRQRNGELSVCLSLLRQDIQLIMPSDIIAPGSWVLGPGLKVKSESEVAQARLTLCDTLDCSPQGSSIHGILQASILEWVAISFSRGSSWPRDWTQRSPALQADALTSELPGNPWTSSSKSSLNLKPSKTCGPRHKSFLCPPPRPYSLFVGNRLHSVSMAFLEFQSEGCSVRSDSL